MRADLFPAIEPPAGAIARLRATLRRRERHRRWRRAAIGAALVVAAGIGLLRGATDRDRADATNVVAFDASLHPALAVADELARPALSPRGSTGALLRRPTADDSIVWYE
ncbi:MAG TPA: hypothetical protein VFG69_20625, partial [Nannocystaceae bacterium]|nr:hypothetical protein [Nannocystaceae bacterium]